MKIESPITTDTNILGGVPVFTGTRVPVQNLFDYLEAGDNIDGFLADFDYIPRNQVIRVLKITEKIFNQPKLYESVA